MWFHLIIHFQYPGGQLASEGLTVARLSETIGEHEGL